MLARPATRPVAVLVLASVAMLAVLLFVSPWLLFWRDEWLYVFQRPDLTVANLLFPFIDTLNAVPVLVYHALLGTVGLREYLPYLLVDWLAHFVCVALLYRVVARESGPWVGAAAAISLACLGSAFEVLLHPFQMQYLFAAAAGLLAIDALHSARPSRRRVAIAAVALTVGIGSSGLGGIMAGLVVAWGGLRRERALLVAATPAMVLYAAWALTWGRDSQRFLGGMGIIETVVAALYGIGAGVCGILGLPPARFAPVGTMIAIGVAIAALFLMRRGYRPISLGVAASAALAGEYGLQAILRSTFGVEHASRSGYLYPAAIFIWLAIAGLIGRRYAAPTRRAVAVGGILLAVVVAGNMRQFAGAALATRDLRATEVAELRALEAMRAEPKLALDIIPDETVLLSVTPRSYFEAIDRFGRPHLGWDYTSAVDQASVDAMKQRLRGKS